MGKSTDGLHWMEHAFSQHPGAMTHAAQREGVSNAEYEKEHEHDSGKAGMRARAALNAKHVNQRRSKRK